MQQHEFPNWEACASTEHALTRPHAISKELCAEVKPPEQVCLTEEEIEKARMAFLEFDKDNNGSIDQVLLLPFPPHTLLFLGGTILFAEVFLASFCIPHLNDRVVRVEGGFGKNGHQSFRL